ncbi:MAG: hypothetical protein WAU71_03045 [Pyrinomonadaceae bacterium]
MSNERQSRIRLEQTQLDEQLAYIDSVCAVLIDSRYGLGRSEGMARNSVWKFEPASVNWLDDFKGDIFSADVIRRHYFQRECALMSCGIAHGRGISPGIGTDLAKLSQTTASESNADAAPISIDPTLLCDNHSRPPPQPSAIDPPRSLRPPQRSLR